MLSQRSVLGVVLAFAVAGAAVAQTQGSLRWPGSTMGLQAPDLRVNVQLSAFGGPSPAERLLAQPHAQGLNIKVSPRSGFFSDMGVYGRMGMLSGRTQAMGAAPGYGESNSVTYGVGVSWELSPRTSAMLGWDSYDYRERDVRATSLGLQWRY